MAATAALCPEDVLLKLAELAAGDTAQGLGRTETLLQSYDDPRLHFLKGSLLAASQRYPEAVAPMRRAIEIAPEFHIARFQLGLLLLTSGLVPEAAEVWAPLAGLEPNDPLRLFSTGLQHMARDEFAEAERLLRLGIAGNQQHPALNKDMQMVLDGMAAPPHDGDGDQSSHAQWLLQLAAKPTAH